MTTVDAPASIAPLDVHARASEAAAVLRSSLESTPAAAIVLGSGLNELAGRIEHATSCPVRSKFPISRRPKVAGHAGQVLCGKLGGHEVIVFQGRFHYYEGHDLETVTFPVRVLQELGVKVLILTAATGGIGDGLRPGGSDAAHRPLELDRRQSPARPE